MILRLLALCLLLAGPALAGRIITYTATSDQSQESANNAAIAGVAKQISSQIYVDQVSKKSETDVNRKSHFTQSYKSQNRVLSDVKLKGIEVKPVSVDIGFKAIASLDLDILTADLQLKIRTIQQEVTEQEDAARKAINERLYANAAKSIEKVQNLIRQYQKAFDQLSQIYPVNDSHNLNHHIDRIEILLIDRLSKIKFEGPSQVFELTRPEMPAWDVSVTDENGPVPSFPLVAKQGGQTLSERRTQGNGSATFVLRNVNFNNEPYSITVEPNLPQRYIKAAGLEKNVVVSYTVNETKCAVRLNCNGVANVCNAIENGLSKRAIFASNNADAISLNVDISAQGKNTLGNLTSYNMRIILRGNGILFSESSTGAGKNEVDALVRFINKLDFSKLQKQLENRCK